jgi:glyoxylase-like metal-dependent hydrolase (beta-lactamase superfamily II)
MKTLVLALATVAGVLVGACKHAPEGATASPTIHQVQASPGGILVNAYLVESATGVVAIDSALTVSDAKVLRQRLDALGKPLRAVLLTHGHPDHYNGVGILTAGFEGVPVIATADVAHVIEESDAAKEKQWKPMFGAEWPEHRAFPNRTARDGEDFTFDGLRFTVHALGQGESHADSYWVLDADGGHAFIGDTVLAGVHAYVTDGHTTRWLANLERLERELENVAKLHPGHGAPGGRELLGWQRDYLNAYRAQVESLRAGRGTLTEEGKQALTAEMKRRYPTAGLEFLIGLGADPVAAELAADR